jgi:hypothetical protein
MSDQDVLDAIGAEAFDPTFSGMLEYNKAKRPREEKEHIYHSYKVWNPNPQKPDAEKTPGIVMRTTTFKIGGERESTTEVVQKVKAVILFASPGRKLTKGGGQAVCQAHTVSDIDGNEFVHQIPSLRIKEPLCRKASAEDVAAILSQWRSYDKAKVDAAVTELTSGGKLQACGIQAKGGFISLCPYARKDPITGQRGLCKSHFYVVAYDIERKREFTMELTGQSIEASNRFIAPFHEFFKYLRTAGTNGLPCYVFSLDIASLTVGNFNIVNISGWKPVAQAENRKQMAERAKAASERYQKAAVRLADADFKKQKESSGSSTVQVAPPKQQAQPQPTTPAVPPAAPLTPTPAPTGPISTGAVSFEDDDINF